MAFCRVVQVAVAYQFVEVFQSCLIADENNVVIGFQLLDLDLIHKLIQFIQGGVSPVAFQT